MSGTSSPPSSPIPCHQPTVIPETDSEDDVFYVELAHKLEKQLSQTLLEGPILHKTEEPPSKKRRSENKPQRNRLADEDYQFVRKLALPLQAQAARKASIDRHRDSLATAVRNGEAVHSSQCRLPLPTPPKGLEIRPEIKSTWERVVKSALKQLTIISLKQHEIWCREIDADLQLKRSEAVEQIRGQLVVPQDSKTGHRLLTHFLRERPSRGQKRKRKL